MKNYHITFVAAAMVLISSVAYFFTSSTPANAGLWDSMMNSNLQEVKPSANYELSTYGYDSRVYEWTPAWNNGISCVFVASNESSGVACYPKEVSE